MLDENGDLIINGVKYSLETHSSEQIQDVMSNLRIRSEFIAKGKFENGKLIITN
jgi:hypothetical protein